MKNYMILLFILQLVFISSVNGGIGAYATCMGLCMAPRNLACIAAEAFGPVYTKCIGVATVQCAGTCYLAAVPVVP